MFNFKIHDVTTWFANNCNRHIAKYLTKRRQPDNEFGQLIEYNKMFFFKNCAKNEADRLVLDLFLYCKKA